MVLLFCIGELNQTSQAPGLFHREIKQRKKKQAEADRIDEKGTETLLAQGHQQTPCEKSTNMVWLASRRFELVIRMVKKDGGAVGGRRWRARS